MEMEQTWHNTLKWLSAHKGEIVSVSCALCKMAKRWRVNDVLAKNGDVSIKSFPTVAAEALGCGRVCNPSRDVKCLMRIDEFVDPNLKSRDMPIILPRGMSFLQDVALQEVEKWVILFAYCRCKHYRPIDIEMLRRKFPGTARMDDLAKKLTCRRCYTKGNGFFTYRVMER